MFLDPNTPAIILAPMEGVMDAPMRTLMAETGGFDFAVSEFIRVSNSVIRSRYISRDVPEISPSHRPLGRSMLPVQIQLLGNHPERLAATATEACFAGARAIDLNFGCPSPTVIRNRGGSALLREPTAIRVIIETLRKALPPTIPVSAKIRIGWESPAEVLDIAQAAADGGASWLVIHARTRAEFYRPGVHWDAVAGIVSRLGIPVVANGDLFTVEDLRRCQRETGCRHFMVGRGALFNPFIAMDFAQALALKRPPSALAPGPSPLITAMRRFSELSPIAAKNKGYLPARIKQWVSMIKLIRPDALPKDFVSRISRARTTEELLEHLH